MLYILPSHNLIKLNARSYKSTTKSIVTHQVLALNNLHIWNLLWHWTKGGGKLLVGWRCSAVRLKQAYAIAMYFTCKLLAYVMVFIHFSRLLQCIYLSCVNSGFSACCIRIHIVWHCRSLATPLPNCWPLWPSLPQRLTDFGQALSSLRAT